MRGEVEKIKHNKHEKPVACIFKRKQTHTIIIDHDDITDGMYHTNIIENDVECCCF